LLEHGSTDLICLQGRGVSGRVSVWRGHVSGSACFPRRDRQGFLQWNQWFLL